MIRIYLDTCCLNRPLDNQSQQRVRLESEAIIIILRRVARGEWTMIGSGAIDDEIAANPDPELRDHVQSFARVATEYVTLNPDHGRRGRQLQAAGLQGHDALHLACAEAAGADVLLTTDDAFVRRARRVQQDVGVRVVNPLTWLEEQPR
ncbi:MAG TPA: PIN domain-containing protein [Longimicrobium sp.]|nr:PIN domain-containing protein [Longimicrobium sp.]